jgi:hypothetical protein
MITRLMFEAAIRGCSLRGRTVVAELVAIESRHGFGANPANSPLSPRFCCRVAANAA